jgi:hypothetical protein
MTPQSRRFCGGPLHQCRVDHCTRRGSGRHRIPALGLKPPTPSREGAQSSAKLDKPHGIWDTLCHYCYMHNLYNKPYPSIDMQSSSPFHPEDIPTLARGVSLSYLLNSPFLKPIIHLLVCGALMTINSILPRRSRLGGYTSTRCSPPRILDCVDIRGDSLIGPVD